MDASLIAGGGGAHFLFQGGSSKFGSVRPSPQGRSGPGEETPHPPKPLPRRPRNGWQKLEKKRRKKAGMVGMLGSRQMKFSGVERPNPKDTAKSVVGVSTEDMVTHGQLVHSAQRTARFPSWLTGRKRLVLVH